MCAGFWWGDKEDKRKVHWATWEKICITKEQGGMGNRDLHSFNKALVAKQVWRMLRNPNSLVARVFRARYYKAGALMDATIKSNASYIWRSLVWSRPLIQKGTEWKIGNGRNVKVFGDSWVDGVNGGRISGKDENCDNNIKVADQLIGQNGDWDEQQLRRVLRPRDLECVRGTSIGENIEQDSFRWKHEAKGTFSVKSAYLLERGYYEANPNRSETDRKMWSRLVWSCSKIRVFAWRAYKNIIPTIANLRSHHVMNDGICLLCRGRWGSSEHTLLFCPRVHDVWKNSRFWGHIRRGSGLNLIDIGEVIYQEFDIGEYELWIILLWKVWRFICKLIHEEKEKVEERTESNCLAIWEAYQAAKLTFANEHVLGVRFGDKSWKKSRRGRYRVDVNVLFNETICVFGVGIIVRDFNGRILVAVSKRTTTYSSVMIAEVIAVVAGITTCIEHKIAPVEIHTDSLLTARVMADPEERNQLLPDDLREIVMVAREYMLIDVFHEFRSANRAAHSLAQFASNFSRSLCWTKEFPSWLRYIVKGDIS